MKIGILGGSNSILKSGWTTSFRAGRPNDDISNLSVGGSGTSLGLYRLCTSPVIDTLDVVILEFCVNDHWLLQLGVVGRERLELYVFHLLAAFASRGVRPVVLIIPTADSIKGSDVRDVWLRQAAALNAPVIDTTLLFEEVARTTGIPAESFFPAEDGSHPKESVQRLIGVLVSLALDNICAEKSVARVPEGYAFPFRAVSLADHFPNLIIPRKTSLLETSLARFEPGASYEMQCSDTLHGVFANRSAAAGICRISWGDDCVVKNMRVKAPDARAWTLNMAFVPLRDQPAMDRVGPVSFEAVDCDTPVTEPATADAQPPEACAVEIEGLLLSYRPVRSGDELCRAWYGAPAPVTPRTEHLLFGQVAALIAAELRAPATAPHGKVTVEGQIVNLIARSSGNKSGSVDFLRDLAGVLLKSDRPAEALSLLEMALRDRPDGPVLHSYACRALLALGEGERALAHLERLPATSPERRKLEEALRKAMPSPSLPAA